MKRQIALTILAAAALIPLVGCEKKVMVSFTNTTNQMLSVSVNGPGKGTGPIGILPATGGKLYTKIKVKKDKLPCNYAWYAGSYSGVFTINEQSPDMLYIDVPRSVTAGARTDNTEIVEKKETTRHYIKTEEVVTPD